MKRFKGLVVTLTTLILLLVLIPLVGILLVYSPNAPIPEAFTYNDPGEKIRLDDYLASIDFENFEDFKIDEKEINIFLNTYIEMGLTENEDIIVNYAYVDFKTQEFDLIAHLNVNKVMDFPVKVRMVLSSSYSEGVEMVKLDRLYLGKLRIPNFVTRYAIEFTEIRSDYLNSKDLSVTLDINQLNPYSKMVVLENVWMDEDAVHLEIGLSNFIADEVVKPSVEIVTESIQEIYTHLNEEEQAAADVILDFVEENPDFDPSSIGINSATDMIEAFLSLSPEVQNELIKDLEEKLDPKTAEQLKQWLSDFIREER